MFSLLSGVVRLQVADGGLSCMDWAAIVGAASLCGLFALALRSELGRAKRRRARHSADEPAARSASVLRGAAESSRAPRSPGERHSDPLGELLGESYEEVDEAEEVEAAPPPAAVAPAARLPPLRLPMPPPPSARRALPSYSFPEDVDEAAKTTAISVADCGKALRRPALGAASRSRTGAIDISEVGRLAPSASRSAQRESHVMARGEVSHVLQR